jgi:hypothetical protein
MSESESIGQLWKPHVDVSAIRAVRKDAECELRLVGVLMRMLARSVVD